MMELLILGLLLWITAHLFPAVAAYKRKKLILKTGLIPYKLSFAIIIVSSIVLMVFGWRSTVPVQIYVLPQWVNYLTMLMVLLTFILIVAAQVRTNIKRVLRHPQLTGLVLWSTGHLLANGDSRSLVLFLGLLIWAKVQIITTNKRDGKRVLPERVPVQNDIATVVGGIVVFIVFFFAHAYITGVSLL
jgi:uncharacterized membrane protein